jgi:hypothetical protein
MTLNGDYMYKFSDGGRAKAGYKGVAGDCAVRAIAIALGLDYKAVYVQVAKANKDCGRANSARYGVHVNVMTEVLKSYGWIWQQSPKFVGRKAKCSDLMGTVIARQARHFVAVIDGIPHDIFDSSQKMVYGYWAKTMEINSAQISYIVTARQEDMT